MTPYGYRHKCIYGCLLPAKKVGFCLLLLLLLFYHKSLLVQVFCVVRFIKLIPCYILLHLVFQSPFKPKICSRYMYILTAMHSTSPRFLVSIQTQNLCSLHVYFDSHSTSPRFSVCVQYSAFQCVMSLDRGTALVFHFTL